MDHSLLLRSLLDWKKGEEDGAEEVQRKVVAWSRRGGKWTDEDKSSAARHDCFTWLHGWMAPPGWLQVSIITKRVQFTLSTLMMKFVSLPYGRCHDTIGLIVRQRFLRFTLDLKQLMFVLPSVFEEEAFLASDLCYFSRGNCQNI